MTNNKITTIDAGEKKIKTKTYLTFEETVKIIGGCVKVYDEGANTTDGDTITDGIANWDKSICHMERNFNCAVLEICTDLKEYDYDELLAEGVFRTLMQVVINAEHTLDTLYKIIEKRDSLPYILDRTLNQLIDKVPTQRQLNNLYNKVKKDLSSGKLDEPLKKVKDIFEVSRNV